MVVLTTVTDNAGVNGGQFLFCNADGMMMDALLKVADERKVDQRLIVVFSDIRYQDVLLNWLIAIHRLNITNYLIVSLDERIHAFLTQRGFPSFLVEFEGPLNNLWRLRLEVIQKLCSHGITVIHSDIDAIWLRNPIPDFFLHEDDQLIISQGTTWPEDVVWKQGFVVCCGLFCLRSSPGTKKLLENMLTEIATTGDDQATLNRVISASVKWESNFTNPYRILLNGHRFFCSEKPIRGYSPTLGINVSVLPHHLFQRIHMPNSPAYVKHLFSDKTGQDKLASFKQSNCLFLRDDWKDIDFTADSIDRISILPLT